MHLTPLFMNMFAKSPPWSEVEEYRIMDCMECGCCQYICPARIPLVQQFRTAKFAIRQSGGQKKQRRDSMEESKLSVASSPHVSSPVGTKNP